MSTLKQLNFPLIATAAEARNEIITHQDTKLVTWQPSGHGHEYSPDELRELADYLDKKMNSDERMERLKEYILQLEKDNEVLRSQISNSLHNQMKNITSYQFPPAGKYQVGVAQNANTNSLMNVWNSLKKNVF